MADQHGVYAVVFLQELVDRKLCIAGEVVEWSIKDSSPALREVVVEADLLVGPADIRVHLQAVRVDSPGALVSVTFGDAEFSANSPTSLDDALAELDHQLGLARHVLARVGAALTDARNAGAEA